MPDFKIGEKEFVLKDDLAIIGRTDQADIVIPHKRLSRMHARITTQGPDVWIEDLGSKNGTFVNGTKIQDKTQINRGDAVKLGDLEMTVGFPEAAIASVMPSSRVPRSMASAMSTPSSVSRSKRSS